ncbi:hypothetical protein PALB_190 [Pseudoalteromonas luteoviolacea B = ATCC 29581]|nr:hypothetical protein PALB_190 [Pseudoalteromonas luteoviolacea B = ATCC 29581]
MTQSSLKPTNKRMTEKRDLHSLPNLESWCSDIAMAFPSVDRANLGNCSTFLRILNAFPLILAYRGETQQSEALLRKIILFWSNQYQQTKNILFLTNAIDPTVNLVRLFKLTGQEEGFEQALAKIDLLQNSSVLLGEHELTLNRLGKSQDILLRAVLNEKTKHELSHNNFSAIFDLEEKIPSHLAKTDLYIEPKVIALINIGKFDAASDLCLQQLKARKTLKSAVYLYRLYEVFKIRGHFSQANVVINHLVINLEKSKISTLSELNFAAAVIKEANLSGAHGLVQQVITGYNAIQDEFNLTLLLVHLNHKENCSTRASTIRKILSKTSYIPLLALNKGEKTNNDDYWKIQAEQKLNSFLCYT